jgi:hypothetical protein
MARQRFGQDENSLLRFGFFTSGIRPKSETDPGLDQRYNIIDLVVRLPFHFCRLLRRRDGRVFEFDMPNQRSYQNQFAETGAPFSANGAPRPKKMGFLNAIDCFLSKKLLKLICLPGNDRRRL